jgi:hypothetical protein
MIWIRSTSGDRYRAYEWAHLFSIQHDKQGRDLWVVEYQDGEPDVWPASDIEAGYDVRIQAEPPEDPHEHQVNEGSGASRAAGTGLPDHPFVQGRRPSSWPQR